MTVDLGSRVASPRAPHSAGRIVGWIFKIVGALLGAVLLVALVGVLVVTHTDWGRAKVLAALMPVIQAQLNGTLRVGHLGGGLLHGLVLSDVELRDQDGQVAVRARRVAASYSLLPLLRKRVELGSVEADGLYVHARYRRDGSLNLAGLKKPSKSPGPMPVTIVVQRATLQADAVYEAPLQAPAQAARALQEAPKSAVDQDPGEVVKNAVQQAPQQAVQEQGARATRSVRVSVVAELSALVGPDRTEAAVRKLALRLEEPLQATVDLSGALRQAGEATAVSDVHVVVRTTGEEVTRFEPTALLHGPLVAELKADGPLTAVVLDLELRPPAGKLDLHATVGATLKELPWQIRVGATGLDPGSVREDLPHGDIGLALRGAGQGVHGALDLDRLAVQLAGARASASGHVDLPQDLANKQDLNLDARAEVDVPDLARMLRVAGPAAKLSKPPKVEGGLGAQAHLVVAGKRIGIDATVRGSGLRVPQGGAHKLAIEAHIRDLWRLDGKASVRGSEVYAGGVRLSALELSAEGTQDGAVLRGEGHGPAGTRLDLEVRAVPRQFADRPLAIDAVVARLLLAAHGQSWSATQQARIHVGQEASVRGLALRSGEQQVALDGRYNLDSGAMDGAVHIRRLDLQGIGAIAGVPQKLPRTALDLDVQARGRVADPQVSAHLGGTVEPLERLALPRLALNLDAHLQRKRLDGQLAVNGIGRVGARFDVPLSLTSPEAPVSLELSLSGIQLQHYKQFLPDAMQTLEGTAALDAHLTGTVRHPDFHALLKVPTWSVGQLRKNSTQLEVSYRDAALTGALALRLAAVKTMPPVGKDKKATEQAVPAGAVDLTLRAPIDLDPTKETASQLDRLAKKVPLSGALAIKGIDLEALRYGTTLLIDSPIQTGHIDGRVDVSGTLEDPALRLDLTAKGLSASDVDQIDVALRGVIQSGRGKAEELVQLNLETWLHGGLILRAQASAPGLVSRLRGGQAGSLKDQPIVVDAFVPAYELSRATQLGGLVVGNVLVRGTPGHPNVRAQVSIDSLRVQSADLGQLRVLGGATFDGVQAAAHLKITEQKGGALAVDANVPMAKAAPWSVDLVAKRFLLDFRGSGAVTAVRSARALLDADWHMRGSRAQPVMKGSVKLSEGAFALAMDPTEYRNVLLDANMQDGRVILRQLSLNAGGGGGNARMWGDAQVNGAHLQRADGHLEINGFPTQRGKDGFWLDAKVDLHADGSGPVLRGRVGVTSASVRLPKLEAGKKVQSLGPLEDVHFVDARAEREAKKKALATQAEPGTVAEVQVQVPGPVFVRSAEVSTTAQANLQIEIAPPQVRITGEAQTSGGWVEILGRRYDIERARVGFEGSAVPDPTLDVRVTRQAPNALLVIEVHGTAKKPSLGLSSEPPVYDQSQVISMVLTGDAAQQQGPERSMDQKVVGAISGLLIGQLKDQLAAQIPVDVLKVDVGSQGYTGIADTRLEVGKYITNSLYISYAHQFGTQTGTRRLNSNQASLEYHFLPKFDLVTMFGDAGVGALDLYWRHQF